MTRTARFGFDKYGGTEGGTASQNGYKFSTVDRDVEDRILAAFEVALASGDALINPSAAPSCALEAGSGSLPGGLTYYYRISYVDSYGLETAGSEEAGITTAALITIGEGPNCSSVVGGTLVPGVYEYAVSVGTSDDGESTLSAREVITLLADRGTIHVDLPALPSGATKMFLYRRAPGQSCCAGRLVRVADVTSSAGSQYVDDGSVIPTGELPPTANTTNGRNAITITAPDSTLVESDSVKSWRIYRTSIQGQYVGNTLVHEVVETTTEGGGTLVTSYVDDGSDPLPGTPLDYSQCLKPPGGGSGSGSVAFAPWLPVASGATPITIDAEGSDTLPDFDVSTATAPSGFTKSFVLTPAPPGPGVLQFPSSTINLSDYITTLADRRKAHRLSFWYALPKRGGDAFAVTLSVYQNDVADDRDTPGGDDEALGSGVGARISSYPAVLWANGMQFASSWIWRRATVTLPPGSSSIRFDCMTTPLWNPSGTDEEKSLHITGLEITPVATSSDGALFIEQSSSQVWLYDTTTLSGSDGMGWYPITPARVSFGGYQGEVVSSSAVAQYHLAPAIFANATDLAGDGFGLAKHQVQQLVFSGSLPITPVAPGVDTVVNLGFYGAGTNPYRIVAPMDKWKISHIQAYWGDPTNVDPSPSYTDGGAFGLLMSDNYGWIDGPSATYATPPAQTEFFTMDESFGGPYVEIGAAMPLFARTVLGVALNVHADWVSRYELPITVILTLTPA